MAVNWIRLNEIGIYFNYDFSVSYECVSVYNTEGKKKNIDWIDSWIVSTRGEQKKCVFTT